jgi:nucleoside-diphosphate-sugar epimerase
MPRDKRTFLAGGAGFTGSNLAKLLLPRNDMAILDKYNCDCCKTIPGDELKMTKTFRGDVIDAARASKRLTMLAAPFSRVWIRSSRSRLLNRYKPF